jgi:hypothetical protein
MDIVVAILVFLGVVIVSVLFFGGWVIVAIVRLLARALGGGRSYAPAPPAPARLPAPPRNVICEHLNCRAPNSAGARFCRRCGRPAGTRVAPVVRRVAMW